MENLGQTDLKFRDKNGQIFSINFQVAEIKKPLVAVTDLIRYGNEVIFDGTGGKIRNVKTGKEVRLREEKTYM